MKPFDGFIKFCFLIKWVDMWDKDIASAIFIIS
jgi:hypothetical protein